MTETKADVVRKAMLAAEARGNDAPIRTITPEMSDKDKEIADLKRQLAETRNTLLLIGDKAVTDWDDPVVGAVDAVVKQPPKSYAEWARNTLANAREAPRLREELAKALLCARDILRGYKQAYKTHMPCTCTHCCTAIIDIVQWHALIRTITPEQGEDCPQCDGPADNGHDREVPPNPYYCKKCQDKPEQDEE